MFGVGVLLLPERQQFGLALHLERIRFQQATATALGIGAVFNKDELPRIWFDAISPTEEQIDSLADTVNMERMHAALMARKGMLK